MPFRIEFQELGDCLEFVDLVLRNKSKLQIRRRDVQLEANSQADDRNVFAVTLERVSETAGTTLLRLARCEAFETERQWPEGEPLTINKLLGRVRLVPQSNMPPGRSLAILLFNAAEPEFRRQYTELLEMGCEGIRVGLIDPAAAAQNLSHVILVESPPTTFWPPAAWLKPNGDRSWTVACYRWRDDADCRLYVQWGYEHPVDRVEHLYFDYYDHEDRDKHTYDRDPYHRVFALHGFEESATPKPQWIDVRKTDYEEIFSLGSQKLELKIESPIPTVDLHPASSDRGLALSLRVQRQARGTSCSLEALETQIAHHQQAVAELQRDYRLAHALRQQAIYLAYIFEQDLDDDSDQPPRLCATFARFLEQPYTELEQMDYAFYELPQENGRRRGLHIVFDNRSESHGRVLTSLADEVYVQRDEWRTGEWNLPLFVRNGDDLRPRLDDPALGRKIRELFWTDGNPKKERLLLRSVSGAGGNGDRPWEALYVRQTTPLAERETAASSTRGADCFRFLNDQFCSQVVEFRPKVPPKLEQVVEDASVRVTDRCNQLERRILEAVQERIDFGEKKWQQVDVKIHEVVAKTEQYDKEVSAAELAISAFPGRWTTFVEQVLTAHENLHQTKIDAAKEYQRVQDAVDNAEKTHATALMDVERRVQQDIYAVVDRKQKYETVEQRADSLLTDLTDKVASFHQQQEQVELELTDRLTVAQDKTHTVETRLTELQAARQELQNQLRTLTLQQANLVSERKEVDKLRRQAEDSQSDIESQRSTLERDRERLELKRQEIQDLRNKLQEGRSRYDTERSDVDKTHDRLRQEKQELGQNQTKLDSRRRRVVKEEEDLLTQCEEIAELEKQLGRQGADNEDLRANNQRRSQACTQRKQELDEQSASLQQEKERAESHEKDLLEQLRQEAEQRKQLRAREENLEQQLAEKKRDLYAALDQLEERLAVFAGRDTALHTLSERIRELNHWLAHQENAALDEDAPDTLNVQIVGMTPEELLEEMRKRLMKRS